MLLARDIALFIALVNNGTKVRRISAETAVANNVETIASELTRDIENTLLLTAGS